MWGPRHWERLLRGGPQALDVPNLQNVLSTHGQCCRSLGQLWTAVPVTNVSVPSPLLGHRTGMALWASHQKMTPRGLCGEGQVQAQARGWRWGSPPLPSGTLHTSLAPWTLVHRPRNGRWPGAAPGQRRAWLTSPSPSGRGRGGACRSHRPAARALRAPASSSRVPPALRLPVPTPAFLPLRLVWGQPRPR